MEEERVVKVKRLFSGAKLPVRGTENSVGLDVFAHRRLSPSEVANLFNDIPFDNIVGYGTGLAFEPPADFFLSFRCRSSIAKTGLTLSNAVGTIDPDYRGEVLALFYRVNQGFFYPYRPGDRIGQIVLERDYRPEIVEVDLLSKTKRGKNGYGHTGD